MKGWFVILLSFFFVLCSLVFVSALTEQDICSFSDINDDLKIDANDYDVIDGQFLIHDTCSESNSWCDHADINQNGKVDAFDYLIIDYGLKANCTDFTETGGNRSELIGDICTLSDLNKDGLTDSNDYSIIDNWFLMRVECNESNSWCNNSDVNQDGGVDAFDYLIIDYGLKANCTVNLNEESINARFEKNICSFSDINDDLKIDANDYDVIDKWFLMRVECNDLNSWCDHADINQNGRVDAFDYLIIDYGYGLKANCTDFTETELNRSEFEIGICNLSDINNDLEIDANDYDVIDKWFLFQTELGNCSQETNWCNRSDINQDGKVDAFDYLIIDYGFEYDCSEILIEEIIVPVVPQVQSPGGGSGGGRSCSTLWNCTEWTECSNYTQTRTCEKIKVNCLAPEKPEETLVCGLENEGYLSMNSNITSTSEGETENQGFFSRMARAILGVMGEGGITGAVVGAIGEGNIGIPIAFIVFVLGLSVTVFMIRKKKKS